MAQQQSGGFSVAAFALVLVFTAAAMLLLGRVIYRDVEKRNGDGAKVVIAFVLFWPLGLYWWHKARSEFSDSHEVEPRDGRVRALESRVAELEAELHRRDQT